MLGALDMFSIGIGPSSSHTIGPMKAAATFINLLEELSMLNSTTHVEVNLFGSLALTGEGHGTMLAVINGLCGHNPKTVDPKVFVSCVEEIKQSGFIYLNNKHKIKFSYDNDLLLHKNEFLLQHSNAMRFIAFSNSGVLLQEDYFSVGGGFVVNKAQISSYADFASDADVPYPFKTATELFSLCKKNNISIATLVTRNELGRKTAKEFYEEASEIVQVMHESVIRGLNTEGVLPGGLNVRRRAPGLYKKLNIPTIASSPKEQRLLAIAYAMAVNEENAAFSRIVTAPTNGAAGTIPGVLEYYRNFSSDVSQDKLVEFILTAGAIGMLYKYGASISAAEVGCQGEIGVACSMAAGALTAVFGGTLIQIEKAAEIGMEHNLGMTCDPVEGLVQIPCIERNGVASSKAIDIAYLSLLEEEAGIISLDHVIKTMLQTGKDMSIKYKETSLGGLAVNIVNC
ncbi:MAG: L-serine ammonia-lyase [Proteobacteria bacterium]|jgi:L-serine dehydratase|nr:L-serine ammonia-lyase [Pseudomonadota bacterium]